MKKCLIIINNAAGKSRKISFEKVEKCLGAEYIYTRFSLPEDGEYDIDGYDAVAVCGGDGTLGALLGKAYKKNIEVFYFPSGTLNDRAKSKRYEHAKTGCPACSNGQAHGRPVVVGCFETSRNSTNSTVSDLLHGSMPVRPGAASEQGSYPSSDGENGVFSYVLAAGSFTPIGYMANAGLKKKLGVVAYIFQIVKQYKICRIPLDIRCGQKNFNGEFTLVMLLKSPRCFGFRFNKAFDAESTSGHLIAIRSPKHNGLLGLVEMFFPFFRVFFIGLKKEREGKIIFKKIYSCDIVQSQPTTYCRDGDKYESAANLLKIRFVRSICNFSVIDKF